jgi:hypothetical protein
VTGDITGVFAGLPDGTVFITGGVAYRINYNLVTSGEDTVVLTVLNASSLTELCNNGIDDDGDNLIDCNDPDCTADPACAPVAEICNNGSDDDGDGAIDCQDTDCTADPACAPNAEICNNGTDDDGDGNVDCNDPDCAAASVCVNGELGGGGGCSLRADSMGTQNSILAFVFPGLGLMGLILRKRIAKY